MSVISKSPKTPKRHRLGHERPSVTHKFVIIGGDQDFVSTGKTDEQGRELFVKDSRDLSGYLTVGTYDDGKPGELFLAIGKAGGVYRGLDSLMIAMSIGLQYGVPIEEFLDKFEHMRFEPQGFTKTEKIPIAKSVVDYIARWVRMRFPKENDEQETPGDPGEVPEESEE